METHEHDAFTTSYVDPTTEEQERDFSTPAPCEDALIERMGNVVLESDENENHETIANGDGNRDVGGLESSDLLPLRPYAGDCPHFVRTGTCKFGLSCRYSHPVKKTQLFVKGGDSDSDTFGTIECKYFSTAGGCKYGKSCRYNHPGEESENTFSELNFLGLPMRLGEKECPYYMRNGSCAYGSRCVFHHPDPASVAGMESPYPMAEKFVSLSENLDVGSMLLPGMSKPGQASRSLHKLSYNVGPYSEDQSSPQWMGKHSEWNGCQDSSYANESRSFYSTPIANGTARKTDVPMHDDEFPERPGQPECEYFMKTGNCKFKSTCRFHHPKNRISMPDECVLNENGLPLRPGRNTCRHYERHGLCKFGPTCLFDHPATHGLSTYPDWPASTTANVSNGWDD